MSNVVNTEFQDYRKEFYEEIRNITVDVKDIKRVKVSDKTLGAEVALRKQMGDTIAHSVSVEIAETNEKIVEKLNEEDIAFDGTVRDICERVVDEKFDSDADMFNAMIIED